MIFLTFLTAIALSAVAAYYSVIGLAEIFPGSFWPVVIMGAVLESSKLVTVSWLYRNWHHTGFLLKGYLSVAVTILMLITSMGIFGYLSKAHLEHSSDTSPLQSKVELLQEKIRVERETIEESRKELKQLDAIVDQTVGRSTDEKGLLQAQALRRTQQKDRNRLVSQIEQSQKSIAGNQEVLAPLSVELKKAEADLGPIKYVAALAYGEEAGVGVVEKAVRLVIGLIIVVFDPLAILLLIAGNISLANRGLTTEVKRSKVWDDFMKKQPTELVVEPEPTVLHDEKHNVSKTYLDEPFKHFENLQPIPAPTTQEEVRAPDVSTRTVEIKEDNMIVIDELGNTIPPIATKYDYTDNFSFREKDKK